ncbi:MAG: hypothetical protein RL477_3 [Pseudomonadota bacterium]
MKYDAKFEQKLMATLWNEEIADNPYEAVMFGFPWGKAGTPLEHHDGPRAWQKTYLQEMAEHIRLQKQRIKSGLAPEMWRHASVSGRGPGKSALVALLSWWMASTCLGSTTIITANSEAQLKTRTFAEMTKWFTLAVNSHWFETTVLSVRPAGWFEKLLKEQLKIDTGYYYVQGQLWSEENPDAFAGVHNPLGVMLVYDEASGIPKPIWNVSEGFFTEPVLHRYWQVFSNGRRNSGPFFDCFNSERAFWKLRNIDSRTVEGTDRGLFERMIAQHGIDSDVVRVEILGQFPKQGSRQFISNDLVRQAQVRELVKDPGAALVIGADIARYGDDSTVLRFRQGRDARSIPPVRLKNRDTIEVCNTLCQWIDRTQPDAVNVDAGNGVGVIDVMRSRKYRVNEVWFGGKSSSPEWANKRTEMYADLRDWLGGGCIDNDDDLFRDLTAPEYDYFGKAKDQVMLESKESMKDRGMKSPDEGDALALTFATPVARRDLITSRGRQARVARDVDYSVFG